MDKAVCPTAKTTVFFFALILSFFVTTSSYGQQTPLPGQWTTTTLVTDNKVRAFAVNGTTLFAGTNAGVWNTADNGTTWTQVNSGLTTTDVRSLIISGTTLYAGTLGGGVFRSSDNGATWTATNTGLTNLVVLSLAANGTDVYAGTFGSGVFRLSGTTWTQVNTGLSSNAQVYSLLINGNDVLAAGQLVVNDAHHIFRSSDKGAKWTATGGTDTSVSVNPPALVYSMAVSGTSILAATYEGLYRSTDNGATWRLIDQLPLRVLNILPVSDVGAVYASGLTPDGSLYGIVVSTDNGATWRASSYGLPGASALAAIGTNLFAAASLGGVSVTTTQPISNVSVSAADFRSVNAHAAESIASLFGTNLATATASAANTPLPTSLAGTTVTIKDSAGTARLAPLFFVSKGQINYQIPEGTASGWAYVTVQAGDGKVSYATINVTAGAFSVFTADAMGNIGSGVPAGYIQRVRANGSQSIEIIGQNNGGTWSTVPIDLGAETDQVFLVLFGTGFRGWNTATNPVVGYFKLNATTFIPATADYAGKQNFFVGVDQVNILLPRALLGAGEITLYTTANSGPFSNTVKIRVR